MTVARDNVPPKILGQSKAIYCFVINQLATPGLGSLIAGRKLAGAGQLCLALAGFFMLTAWMVTYFLAKAQEQLGESPPANSHAWLGKWGLIAFAASWLWSLTTSIGLLRQTRNEMIAGERPPPRIIKPTEEM